RSAASAGGCGREGEVRDYTDRSVQYQEPQSIAASGESAWFTLDEGIGRISADGTIRRYTDPAIFTPLKIVAGPGGAAWFSNEGRAASDTHGSAPRIARITPHGGRRRIQAEPPADEG